MRFCFSSGGWERGCGYAALKLNHGAWCGAWTTAFRSKTLWGIIFFQNVILRRSQSFGNAWLRVDAEGMWKFSVLVHDGDRAQRRYIQLEIIAVKSSAANLPNLKDDLQWQRTQAVKQSPSPRGRYNTLWCETPGSLNYSFTVHQLQLAVWDSRKKRAGLSIASSTLANPVLKKTARKPYLLRVCTTRACFYMIGKRLPTKTWA